MILGAITLVGAIGYITYSNYIYKQHLKNNPHLLTQNKTTDSFRNQDDDDDDVEDD